eukprot:jgi/Tetstr1/457367/TSEL_043970.t1
MATAMMRAVQPSPASTARLALPRRVTTSARRVMKSAAARAGPSPPARGVLTPQLPAAAGSPLRPAVRSASVKVQAAAVAAEPPANEPAPAPSDGLQLVPAAISIAVGLAVRFLVPIPEGLTVQAWNLLSIFLSTVVGLVLKPMPVGAWAFTAATFTILTKNLDFQTTFSALTNEVIWLIVVACIFARAFVKTGFGDRLALFFVRLFGKTTLSLAYGLQAAEMAICPAMPSTTARAGGVFVPIINSLDQRTQAYLTSQQLQGGNNTSSILLTAAAQNFLCIKLAEQAGVVFTNPFSQWLIAASVPCLVAIVLTPYLIYLIDPPGVKDTPEAPVKAAEQLAAMGGLKDSEKKMLGGLGVTVVLWILGAQLGVSAVLAAMIGLVILLATGVVTWDDALEEKGAWDTLVWFTILISLSAQLNALGVVSWLAGSVSAALTAMQLGWMQAFGILHVGYYILHYFFASQTAHVGALYTAFLGMMMAAGAPPVLAALTLGFNTNLFGGMTHFASGQSAVYFGTGHVELAQLWKQGAYCAVLNFAVWGVVGMIWWKLLGLY